MKKVYVVAIKVYVVAIIVFIGVVIFVGSSALSPADGEHSCEEELTKLLPQGYRLSVNQEWVKVYYVDINEPYRAWTINYSDGLIYDGNGKWRSLYRKPTMSHVDMRDLMDGEITED